MVITATSTAIYIADKMVAQFIKEEGYGRLKTFFFPKSSYKGHLASIINQSITEFENAHPRAQQTDNKFPFYHSQLLFEQLNNQIFFDHPENPLLAEEFQKNENIIVPSQEEIESFYAIFTGKIKADQKLKKLHIEETYKEKIILIYAGFQTIASSNAQIISQVTAMELIVGQNNTQLNQLRNRFEDLIQLTTNDRLQGLVLYPKGENIIDRSALTQDLYQKINNYTWLHLHGNVLTGKTQLSLLLADRFNDKFFIALADFPPSVAITQLLRELGAFFGVEVKLDTLNELVQKIPADALLILDGLPKLDLNKEALLLLKTLVLAGRSKNIKILSTSNHSLAPKVKTQLAQGLLSEQDAPPFTVDDIHQLLMKNGAEEQVATALKTTVYTLAGNGHPAIANAICQYLKDCNWKIDRDALQDLFSGNYSEELIVETYEKLIKTITDDQTKELLFRLKVIIGSIRDQDVTTVADVKPFITFPFIKINNLIGTWISRTKPSTYLVSPLIGRIKDNNLSAAVSRNINDALGKAIMSVKKIDLLDAHKAIRYFINAGKYNQAGTILATALDSLSRSESENTVDSFFFDLWKQDDLPKQMDIFLQSTIRFYQISNLLKKNEIVSDYLLSDYERIVNKAATANINVAHGFIFLAILYAKTNPDKSAQYILLGLKHAQEITAPGATTALSSIAVSMTSFLWNGLVEAKSITDFEDWLPRLLQLSPEQLTASMEGDLSSLCCLQFCQRLYDLEGEKDIPAWPGLIDNYDQLITAGQIHGLTVLLACAAKFKIRCLCEKINAYPGAIAVFNTLNPDLPPASLSIFFIADELGRQLFYHNQSELALPYLVRAVDIEVGEVFTDKIDTLLVLNQIFGERDPIQGHGYIEQAYHLQHNNQFVSDVLSAKVIGEFAISTWETGQQEKVFAIIEEGLGKLLFGYKPLGEYQATIIRFGHITGFYDAKLRNVPLALVEGKPYTPPFRGMFTRTFDKLLQDGYYFEQRKFMQAFLMEQCFETVPDFTLARKWAYLCFQLDQEKVVNAHFTLLTPLLVFYILDNQFEEAIIRDLSVMKRLNAMNTDPAFGEKLDNPRLEALISERPRPVFDRFDDFIFKDVQVNITLKFLWDYVDHPDDAALSSFIAFCTRSLAYYDDPYIPSVFIEGLSLLQDQGDVVDKITSLAVQHHPLATQLKLLLNLLASVRADHKKALQLHLGLIQRLEMDAFAQATHAAYLFLIVPFVIAFWKKRIEKDKAGFFEYAFMVNNGIPKVERAQPTDKLKVLFRVLCHHLEVDEPDRLKGWFL